MTLLEIISLESISDNMVAPFPRNSPVKIDGRDSNIIQPLTTFNVSGPN